MIAYNRPSVGLVLSGGGARGFAHIGVLRVLEREGIPVDYLAGTSMGGVIAAGYASGMNSYDLERETVNVTKKLGMLRMADPGIPNGGLIRGHRVLNYFKRMFGEKTFSELPLPLAVVAADLRLHQEVVFTEGSVALALRATVSIPGIFMPIEINGRELVDGGLLNNMPVDVAKKMGAEVVIAVDIGLTNNEGVDQWIGNHRWIPGGIANTLEVLDDSLYALRIVHQESKLKQFPPDVLICPVLPKRVNSIAGYNKVEELVAAGERAAEEHLTEIEALLHPR
ncbi:MAG: patatin-like phospholipase family protein [Anaerolineaceae bacterium]